MQGGLDAGCPLRFVQGGHTPQRHLVVPAWQRPMRRPGSTWPYSLARLSPTTSLTRPPLPRNHHTGLQLHGIQVLKGGMATTGARAPPSLLLFPSTVDDRSARLWPLGTPTPSPRHPRSRPFGIDMSMQSLGPMAVATWRQQHGLLPLVRLCRLVEVLKASIAT